MTVLSACQSAALRLMGKKPLTIFTSTETFEMELADLATETAIAIFEAHDWQALRTLKTNQGDGSTTEFDLPSDYGRMLVDGRVHSAAYLNGNYERVENENDWLYINDWAAAGVPGYWILLGGKMQIYPAMPANETARYYYMSNQIVSGGKSAFTADTDSFVLDERLLTLGLIWRWRAQKRYEYAEDMQTYEIALSKAISRDKGARILVKGAQRVPYNVSIAYPRALG